MYALQPTQNALKIKAMSLGSNIRRIRKDKGMTLERVAEAFGSDTGNLSRIENDKQDLTTSRLKDLARILEVDVAEFFREPGSYVHDNVEPYDASQQTIERVQLLADFDVLPVDLQAIVVKKATDFRRYFDALPPAVRKNFSRPGDPNKFSEWERDIEADIAGVVQRDQSDFLLRQHEANLGTLPAPVRKTVQQAQKELDKHREKDGPRWVFVLVSEDAQKGDGT